MFDTRNRARIVRNRRSIRHANDSGEAAGRCGSPARLDSFLVTESRLAQMHMNVNQPWRYGQSSRVNLFNFCLLTSETCSICDSPVSNVEIGNFIPFIRGIDHAPVANNERTHVWGARASRVLASASSRSRTSL